MFKSRLLAWVAAKAGIVMQAEKRRQNDCCYRDDKDGLSVWRTSREVIHFGYQPDNHNDLTATRAHPQNGTIRSDASKRASEPYHRRRVRIRLTEPAAGRRPNRRKETMATTTESISTQKFVQLQPPRRYLFGPGPT